MANITEILGTDSLSGSRPTINSNFTALNNEIADITALIDPVTSTITGIDSISAQQLTLSTIVNNVNTAILQVDSTTATFSVAASFGQSANLTKAVIKSGKQGAPGSGNGSASGTPDFSVTDRRRWSRGPYYEYKRRWCNGYFWCWNIGCYRFSA